MNSGGIRNTIVSGEITFSEMMGVLPFSDTIDLVKLTGEHLKSVLEESIKNLHCTNGDWRGADGGASLLQLSGTLYI